MRGLPASLGANARSALATSTVSPDTLTRRGRPPRFRTTSTSSSVSPGTRTCSRSSPRRGRPIASILADIERSGGAGRVRRVRHRGGRRARRSDALLEEGPRRPRPHRRARRPRRSSRPEATESRTKRRSSSSATSSGSSFHRLSSGSMASTSERTISRRGAFGVRARGPPATAPPWRRVGGRRDLRAHRRRSARAVSRPFGGSLVVRCRRCAPGALRLGEYSAGDLPSTRATMRQPTRPSRYGMSSARAP